MAVSVNRWSLSWVSLQSERHCFGVSLRVPDCWKRPFSKDWWQPPVKDPLGTMRLKTHRGFLGELECGKSPVEVAPIYSMSYVDALVELRLADASRYPAIALKSLQMRACHAMDQPERRIVRGCPSVDSGQHTSQTALGSKKLQPGIPVMPHHTSTRRPRMNTSPKPRCKLRSTVQELWSRAKSKQCCLLLHGPTRQLRLPQQQTKGTKRAFKPGTGVSALMKWSQPSKGTDPVRHPETAAPSSEGPGAHGDAAESVVGVEEPQQPKPCPPRKNHGALQMIDLQHDSVPASILWSTESF